jgi:arylformamidase
VKYWDISPPIDSSIAVFPGDQAFARRVSLSFPQNHLTLSSILTTLHLGAHADASNHYHADGEGIEKRPLTAYLGQCQVIQVKATGGRIQKEELPKILAKRVLLRTDSFPNPNQWREDFRSLSPDLIEHLHQQGVFLVGIDTPSVDPADSKALESHQALWQTKMAVLEGLFLQQVNPGFYSLVALPLALKNADASPVRAILLEQHVDLGDL